MFTSTIENTTRQTAGTAIPPTIYGLSQLSRLSITNTITITVRIDAATPIPTASLFIHYTKAVIKN
jgi:hypothetical protein